MKIDASAICATIIISLALLPAGLCNENERSFSTSVAGMEALLNVEHKLLGLMQQYADALQHKLDALQSGIKSMRSEYEKSQLNTEAYLSNPINAFGLIRHMHNDWIAWELFMRNNSGQEFIEQIQEARYELPSEQDLREAVSAIHRVELTYGFQPQDMAAGLLNGKQYDVSLNAMDTYSIGLQLLADDEFYYAAFWVYTSLQTYSKNIIYDALDFTIADIYQAYAETLFKQERYGAAIVTLKSALLDRPDRVLVQNRLRYFETLNKTMGSKKYVHTAIGPDRYEMACRGYYLNTKSKLYCLYNRTTSDFLKLAPLKMELVSLDPYMVLYHDVISDKEIAEVQEMAKPHLKRATVYHSAGSKVVDVRTSKFAWFPDNSTETTKRINQRIRDMTGFELFGSEMLQAMNYGLGGHYGTHYDFFNASADSDIVKLNGDRISTVLFYLSNVDQGGATVFPNIEMSIFPQKGSAVVWYNLDNKGNADSNTLHAACPVIVGSKWVLNKWIRSKNQIFRRPCH